MRLILAVLLLALGTQAHAQSAAPIRIVVPTTAGGPLDVVARTLATVLARNMKDTVIVDNRPGASAMIGTDHVSRSAPDGRTLLLGSGFIITNAVTMKTAFDPVRDLAPVIELTHAGMVVAVRRGLDASGPADLQRAAARQPGGLNCAAPPGEAGLACEQLRFLLGGAVVVVPYPGVAPAMNALISGQVDIALAPYDAVLPLMDRVVPIATTGTRPAMAPFDRLPLLRDTWPGFEVEGFLGVMAAPGTPDAVLRALNREFNAALKDPQVRDFMLARGSTLEADTPPEKLARTIAERFGYYRRLAETVGIKPQ